MGRVVVETYEGVRTYVFDDYKKAKNFYEDTCESDGVRLVELYDDEDLIQEMWSEY